MEGSKKIEGGAGALQVGTAACPHSEPAVEGPDSGVAGCSRVPMQAGVDSGGGMTRLTVHARSGRTAPMLPVYVVERAHGKLSVRPFSESWRCEAERLELALNKGRV